MPTFALISEGRTDQIILERMITQICDQMFEDGVDVNPLQPLRDATDAAAAPHGGWELVLEFCEQRAAAALETNDYVVIHLDTDQGDHPNYGLPLTIQGVDRTHDALVDGAIEILIKRLGRRLYNLHIQRFLFAISIHSMESWLLLCLFNLDEPKNSLERLNRRRAKANQRALSKEASEYLRVAREIKRKRLLEVSAEKHSLGYFLVKLVNLQSVDSKVS